MQKSLQQLPLGLSLKDEATFDNFYPGKNAAIIHELKKSAQGKGENILYLCGARGQGLSHLLQACCHEAHQTGLRSVYLPFSVLLNLTPNVLSDFEPLSLVCLDDIEAIAGKPAWEEAVFHLYNRIYDTGGKLIIAAHDLPKALHLSLADLESRLSFGVLYQLHPLHDEEKLAALTMRAARRGIVLPEEVGRYILRHCPRHMRTLFAALEVLDRASLAAQRKLTIPFVKEVLEV